MERTTVPGIAPLIAALDGMAAHFGLARVEAEQLFAPAKPNEERPARRCAIRGKDSERALKLTFSDYFTTSADAVVCDETLGSLALVHFPFQAEGTTPDVTAIHEYITRRIDAAAYARHLLLEALRPEAGQSPRSPYIIEVVFMIAGTDIGASVERCMGQVLRKLARDAAILMGLGVNLWREDFGSDVNRRRAFPWMLHETKAWYDRESSGHGITTSGRAAMAGSGPAPKNLSKPVRQLASLTMKDFRVAGERTWTLNPNQALHIVRGYNGSGKTSIVEALELAATGRVERITSHPTEKDHQRVITNRQVAKAGRAASLDLRFLEGPPHSLSVVPSGASETLKPASPVAPSSVGAGAVGAASFRMHQAVGDQLSQGAPEVRGRILMEAFFPEQSGRLNELDDRQAQFKLAVAHLPGWLAESLPKESPSASSKAPEVAPQQAAQELDWLGATSAPWKTLREFLVLKRDDYEVLKPLLSPSFCAKYDLTDTVGKTALARAVELNLELDALFRRPAELSDPITALQKLLDEYSSIAEVVTNDVGGTPDTRLNSWLELVALCDLHEREDGLLTTLDLATRYQYSFQPDETPLLAAAPPLILAERRIRLEGLRTRRDHARQALDSSADPTGPRSQADRLPELALADEKLLDAAARFGLLGDDLRETQVSLGAALRQAIHTGIPVPLSTAEKQVPVGLHGWTSSLRSALSASSAALERLNTLQTQRLPTAGATNESVHWFPTDIEARLSKVRSAAESLSKTGSDVVQEVEKLLGRESHLGRALNELMSLFTPARWAYEDLVSEARVGNGVRALELAVGGDAAGHGVPAQLRWNTAELNACAISLFLLCARTPRNPYGLIVLDDPLQNMDELTVVAVARGVGRLLRLWNAIDGATNTWRVVLLLHSEEHLERIRQEVSCAVYLLPWLSPEQAGEAAPCSIAPIASHLDSKLQSLEGMVALSA